MRIDRFIPTRGVVDPLTNSGHYQTFVSGHLQDAGHENYDLYLIAGTAYVCRGGAVGVFLPQGTVFVRGQEGEKLCAEFAKKWPRPKPATPQAGPDCDP